MKIRNFLSVVPQAVKRWALVIAGCVVLIGLAVGYHAAASQTANLGAGVRTMFIFGGAGLFGVVIATWLVCLGFVYGDARQRAMRPVLWVLVAALFPHLLGFLLYFVLRQPIALPCAHCGQTVPLNQRFCAWCGNPQARGTSGEARMAADPC
jgi:Phospholipase_D-nuclease N-terminal